MTFTKITNMHHDRAGNAVKFRLSNRKQAEFYISLNVLKAIGEPSFVEAFIGRKGNAGKVAFQPASIQQGAYSVCINGPKTSRRARKVTLHPERLGFSRTQPMSSRIVPHEIRDGMLIVDISEIVARHNGTWAEDAA